MVRPLDEGDNLVVFEAMLEVGFYAAARHAVVPDSGTDGSVAVPGHLVWKMGLYEGEA